MDDKKEQLNPSQILDEIIALTFTRHARLDEKEFLAAIKAPDGAKENDYARKCIFTLLSAATREILKANDKITLINQTISLLSDNNKKGE